MCLEKSWRRDCRSSSVCQARFCGEVCLGDFATEDDEIHFNHPQWCCQYSSRYRTFSILELTVNLVKFESSLLGPKSTEMLDNPKLVRWFAQNPKMTHEKLEPIPLGLENQHWKFAGYLPSLEPFFPYTAEHGISHELSF